MSIRILVLNCRQPEGGHHSICGNSQMEWLGFLHQAEGNMGWVQTLDTQRVLKDPQNKINKCPQTTTYNNAPKLLTSHHLTHNRCFCFRLWCRWQRWATPAFSWWAAVGRHLRRGHGSCPRLWFHSASAAVWFHLHTGGREHLHAKVYAVISPRIKNHGCET